MQAPMSVPSVHLPQDHAQTTHTRLPTHAFRLSYRTISRMSVHSIVLSYFGPLLSLTCLIHVLALQCKGHLSQTRWFDMPQSPYVDTWLTCSCRHEITNEVHDRNTRHFSSWPQGFPTHTSLHTKARPRLAPTITIDKTQ